MILQRKDDQELKEVQKADFRQDGQIKKQRWEESEKGKSQNKEDAGARKGRKGALEQASSLTFLLDFVNGAFATHEHVP